MFTAVLSAFIILVFFGTGDWLHRILGGGACRTRTARVVLSAWAGLITCIVVLTTIFHVVGTVTIASLAWPVALLCVGASLACPFILPPRSAPNESFPPGYLLIATIGFALIAGPLLGLTGPGFYSTNPNGVNPMGELVNYAAIADVIKHHSLTGSAGFAFPVDSRETVVGSLCAFFSTLTRTSTLFIVEPLAYALAWLSFASLALLFHRAVRRGPIALWQDAAILLTYAVAILSASNQELWTLSFLSQYASMALFFGLLAFLVESADRGAQFWKRKAVATGIAVGALFCAYPEMFLACMLLLAVFWLFSRRGAPRSLTTDFATLGIMIAAAAVAGNKLAWHELHVFAGGTTSLTVRAGWDFLGPTAFRTIAGNLFGLSNLFYAPQPPGLLLIAFVALAGVATVIHAGKGLFAPATPASRGIGALVLCYAAVSMVLFSVVIAQHRETNYLAVKFAQVFVWIFFLGAASAAASMPLTPRGIAAAVMCLILLVRITLVGDTFAAALDGEGSRTRFSTQDAEAVRSALGPAPDVFVAAQLWSLKVVGVFLVTGEDLLHAWSAYPASPITQYSNQKYVLTVGPESASQTEGRRTSYHLVLRRDALTLWERNAGGHQIRSITGSSTYRNQSEFAPANAADGDEGTSWAAQGSGPATLTLTPSEAGTLEGVTLVSRGTGLLECWQMVEVTLALKGQVVSRQTFTLADASEKRVQQLALRMPTSTDRIDLAFAQPVTRSLAGLEVDPARLNPGYSEIVLTWKP